MVKRFFSTLLSFIIIFMLIPDLNGYAQKNDESSGITCKEDNEVGISYSDSVGWYLKKEIPHGLEFEILGNDIDLSSIKSNYPSSTLRSDESGYFNPSDYISEQVGTLTIEGVWWGGIIDEWFISGAVAAATIATSDNTQSKAKIKPGINANWSSTAWTDKNVRAAICDSVGLMGNKAAWDLRLYFE